MFRNLSAVENLIEEHKQLREEMILRNDSVEICLNVGRKLLSKMIPETADYDSSLKKDNLVNSRSEVRDRCVQLATGRILLNELWQERWDRLHLLLEVRQFARDANAAEAWLANKELILESARHKFGENIMETLALFNAHHVFMQTMITAEERFNALKKLTTVNKQIYIKSAIMF